MDSDKQGKRSLEEFQDDILDKYNKGLISKKEMESLLTWSSRAIEHKESKGN